MIMVRQVLLAVTLAFAGCILSGADKPLFQIPPHTSSTELKGSKPNVLIIMADDTTWRDYGFMGNDNARTPTLDRLASEGVVMDRLYTAASMCAPCRSHLYTGIYPVKSGAHPNHCITKDNTKSIVHYLRDQGYRVGLSGKWHVAPKSVYPFESIPGMQESCSSPENPLPDYEPSVEFWNRDKEKPFCQVMAFVYGHCPWTAGNSKSYNPGRIVLPDYVYDTPAIRKVMCEYLAEIEYLDIQVEQVLERLKKNKLYDNTVIIFLSEQGMSYPWAKKSCYEDGLKAAGFVWWPGKIKPRRTKAVIEYVDVLPTLIELAGGTPDQALEGRSFIEVLTGRKETHKTEAYGIQTTLCSGGKPYPIRTVRDERYRLIVNYLPESHVKKTTVRGIVEEWSKFQKTDPKAKLLHERLTKRPRIELYDHSKDPFEINNLADNPEYQDVLTKLMAKLNAWLDQQGDSDPVKTELDAINRCKNKKRVAEAQAILKEGNFTSRKQ